MPGWNSSDAGDSVSVPEHFERLSRSLATILRHSGPRDGLLLRSDGFFEIQKLLPLLKKALEAAWITTEPMDEPAALQAIQTVVAQSYSGKNPRFELRDDTWIRATHKHTISFQGVDVSTDAGTEVSRSAASPQYSESTWVGAGGSPGATRVNAVRAPPASWNHGSKVDKRWEEGSNANSVQAKDESTTAYSWLDLLGDSRSLSNRGRSQAANVTAAANASSTGGASNAAAARVPKVVLPSASPFSPENRGLRGAGAAPPASGAYVPSESSEAKAHDVVRKAGACHQWQAAGTCRFGDTCRFAHDVGPAAYSNEPTNTSARTAERLRLLEALPADAPSEVRDYLRQLILSGAGA